MKLSQNLQSFRGVYIDTGKTFTPEQYRASCIVKNRMTSRFLYGKNGVSSECRLKRKGYDVLVRPTEDNSVTVLVVKELQRKRDNTIYNEKKSKIIGTYKPDRTGDIRFTPNDIETKLEKTTFDILTDKIIKPVLLLLAFILGLNVLKNCNSHKDSNVKIDKKFVLLDTNKDNFKFLGYNMQRVCKR